jgi:sarcosine/dimethylglycine N-methyltransferase
MLGLVMAERTTEVRDHWTRRGVLARLDAVLTELGHNPQNLTPEILATVEHLHIGGIATTRDRAKQVSLTPNSRVLDVGCGMGGPARFLAHTYGCRVDGIDVTTEWIEAGQVLNKRCGLSDSVTLRSSDALNLPYGDQTFDVVWCQNVTMNIADKSGFLAGVYRVLKRGGAFTSTEFSHVPGSELIFPVPWAYDTSISFLDSEDVMRTRLDKAGFRVLVWINYTNIILERAKQMEGTSPGKLTAGLVWGEDAPQRQRNLQRNLMEKRAIYWMITAERP